MAKKDKISVCFLCLRNIEKKKAGHGYCNKSNSNGNLLLLKRFLSWSLDLPPTVIGDLLCTNGGTGGGGGQQGRRENLLCGSCEMEMGAACQLYNELATKLMELEQILENSVKKVSDKLSANLYQKVAKQLMNHSFGSSKEGGRRVQRLRDLLALKLATAKAKIVEDEVSGNGCNRRSKSGNGTSKTEDFQGTVTYHENRYSVERETEPAWTFEFDQGDDEESGATVGFSVSVNEIAEDNEGEGLHVENDDDDDDDDGGGSGQCNAGPISTSAAKASGNLGLGVERPFMCLRCSESFRDIDSVQRHHELCKPLFSCGNVKPTRTPTSEKGNLKPLGRENGMLLQEDVDVDVNMEVSQNSSAAAEAVADADDTSPFQCLRCNDRFKNIQDVEKHEEWCKPLVSSGNRNSTPPPTSEKAKLKPVGPENGMLIQEDIDIDVNVEDRNNWLAAVETETGDNEPFQCLRCNDRFKNIQDVKKHEEWCKPLVSSGNGKSPTPPRSENEKAILKKPMRPENGKFLHEEVHEDVDVDVNMEISRNSSAAAEAVADAEDTSPFQCLRCNDRFQNIQDVEKHEEWCKPLVSSGNKNATPPPTSEKTILKKPMEPDNGRFREDVDINMNMEERSNSFVAPETEAEINEPFQCLRCNDRFTTIQDVGKHEEWCKPLKVTDLEVKPGSAKKSLRRGRRAGPYSGPGRSRNSRHSKLSKFAKATCRICDKNFLTNYHLKIHERIHTMGVKSFQCPKCKMRFNQNSHYITHLKKCKTSAERKNDNKFFEEIPLGMVTVTEQLRDHVNAVEV